MTQKTQTSPRAVFAQGECYADANGNLHTVTELHDYFLFTRMGNDLPKLRNIRLDDDGNEVAVTASSASVDTSWLLRATDNKTKDGTPAFTVGKTYFGTTPFGGLLTLKCVKRYDGEGSYHGYADFVIVKGLDYHKPGEKVKKAVVWRRDTRTCQVARTGIGVTIEADEWLTDEDAENFVPHPEDQKAVEAAFARN